MTGADWLLDALAAEGVTHLFGNPGSTELPLIDALGRQDRVRYVLCLHEAVAVGMADGYAQATGEMAAVNVHVQPGMANALSGVLNARRARVPLLVTVGQQVTDLLAHAPFLGGDILGMAEPLAKAGWEPTTPDALARDFASAVGWARSDPAGPAVLSLPLDVQVAAAPARHTPAPRAAPAPVADRMIADAARMIDDSERPAIVAGDGVVHACATGALTSLAERLDCPIFGEPLAARAPLPTDHRLWRGPLGGFAAQIREALKGHDLVVAVGMPVFRLFGSSPGAALAPGQRLIHVDVDPQEIGRSYRPEVGLCADPADFLTKVTGAVAPRRRRGAPTVQEPSMEPNAGGADISPSTLARAIARIVTAEDIVVDEALTSGRGLRRALVPRTPDNWFAHRGSALGWGLPAAVGIALARPERRVMAIQGDGGALFGLSALWSAAHRRRGVALIIADNRGYEILRAGMEGMTGRPEGAWPGLRLDDPPLDLEALCRGYGASVTGASSPDELDRELDSLWNRAESGPAVVVVRVTGRTPPVGYPLGD